MKTQNTKSIIIEKHKRIQEAMKHSNSIKREKVSDLPFLGAVLVSSVCVFVYSFFSHNSSLMPSIGFNPRWDCTLSFQLQVPELALVRFVVEDHDHTAKNDFVGQFTLPLTSLRTGKQSHAITIF